MSSIKIRSLIGSALRTYIPSMVQVRSEVLRNFPALRSGNVDEDTKYLQHLAQVKEAMAVLVFDDAKIVGVALGVPLEHERMWVQKAFLDRGLNVAEKYFFGACSLLPPYRGRGITHHFFDLREAHVQHLKRFKKICLLELTDPPGPLSLDAFWKKRGYVKQRNLECQWKEVTLVYWMKEVMPIEASLKEVNLLSATMNAL